MKETKKTIYQFEPEEIKELKQHYFVPTNQDALETWCLFNLHEVRSSGIKLIIQTKNNRIIVEEVF